MQIEKQILKDIILGLGAILIASCGEDKSQSPSNPLQRKDTATSQNDTSKVDSLQEHYNPNNCPACGMG